MVAAAGSPRRFSATMARPSDPPDGSGVDQTRCQGPEHRSRANRTGPTRSGTCRVDPTVLPGRRCSARKAGTDPSRAGDRTTFHTKTVRVREVVIAHGRALSDRRRPICRPIYSMKLGAFSRFDEDARACEQGSNETTGRRWDLAAPSQGGDIAECSSKRSWRQAPRRLFSARHCHGVGVGLGAVADRASTAGKGGRGGVSGGSPWRRSLGRR
jgi:hypothetical protein